MKKGAKVTLIKERKRKKKKRKENCTQNSVSFLLGDEDKSSRTKKITHSFFVAFLWRWKSKRKHEWERGGEGEGEGEREYKLRNKRKDMRKKRTKICSSKKKKKKTGEEKKKKDHVSYSQKSIDPASFPVNAHQWSNHIPGGGKERVNWKRECQTWVKRRRRGKKKVAVERYGE